MSADIADRSDDARSSLHKKASDLMHRGRKLNVGDRYNQEAFDLLSKAIKLDPHLIEAWIELTECYQRKSDIEGAIACLENALKYCDSEKPNKIILRRLSTCIRQKTCNSHEAKIATLLRSLELSKQALKSDMYDEENYYNLAKAYMCLFFVTECVDQQLINLSRAAFTKALSLSNDSSSKAKQPCDDVVQSVDLDKDDPESSKSNSDTNQELESKPFIEQSDFLFNYSTVLVYLQEFQKALEYLRIAIKLDPDWTEPKVLEECLVDYLKQIHLMMSELSKNNKKVVRRYTKIVDSLNNVDKIEAIIRLDQQRLLKSMETKIQSFTLSELESMLNEPQTSELKTGKKSPAEATTNHTANLLHLKLVNTINYNQAMYLTFIAIDRNYALIVVTIYSVAASRCPTPRDVVTIVDPKIEEIRVDKLASGEKDSCITYRRINVREFRSFYVNGLRITTDQVSKPQFRVSVLP